MVIAFDILTKRSVLVVVSLPKPFILADVSNFHLAFCLPDLCLTLPRLDQTNHMYNLVIDTRSGSNGLVLLQNIDKWVVIADRSFWFVQLLSFFVLSFKFLIALLYGSDLAKIICNTVDLFDFLILLSKTLNFSRNILFSFHEHSVWRFKLFFLLENNQQTGCLFFQGRKIPTKRPG